MTRQNRRGVNAPQKSPLGANNCETDKPRNSSTDKTNGHAKPNGRSKPAPKLRLVDELWERWEQAVIFLNFFRASADDDQHVFQRLDDRPTVVTEIVNGKERKRKKPRPGRTGEEIGSFNDGGISELFEKLVKLNDEKDCGIYFTVNRTDGQGRKLKNILGRRAIWNEYDRGDALANFPLEPSLIVESSRGKFHCYWLVEGDLSSEAFAGLMQVQVDQFGSDPFAKDETRVLRVPGFYWRKGETLDGKAYPKAEPFLVRLVKGDGRRYTAQELIDAFKPEIEKPRSSDNAEPRPAADPEMVEPVRSALKHVIPKDRGHWIGTLGALFDGLGDDAHEVAAEWCDYDAVAEAIEEFDDNGLDYAWGYLKSEPRKKARTLKSIFYDARQAGWSCIEFDFADIFAETRAEQKSEQQGDKSQHDKPTFSVRPYEWTEPEQIDPRQWLGRSRHHIRKFVSVTAAPGGKGKTSLAIVEALEMVTGRRLLCEKPETQPTAEPLRVYYWNGEDPLDEVQRRIQAACKRYGIKRKEIEGRLFVGTGDDSKIMLAKESGKGLVVIEPLRDAMIAELKAKQIDVFTADPFIRSHGVSENDNVKIDAVCNVFREIARKAGVAVELLHHVRKTGGLEVTAEDMRGGQLSTRRRALCQGH